MRKTLRLDEIDLQGGTQPRAMIDMDVVHDYAEAYADGAPLPPIVVFADGAKNWLADGFHRFHALMRLARETVDAEVLVGTQRDAILHSVGANTAHGLRRTNADKRKAVMTLLQDEEWGAWSDHQIAECCGVAQSTVSRCRAEIETNRCNGSDKRMVRRGGQTYEMDVSGINESNRERKPKQVITSAASAGPISGPDLDMAEPTQSDEIRFWSQACENLKVEVETLQEQVAHRDREILFLTRQLDAIGEIVGEKNHAKIAERVKAMQPTQEAA